jgi:hypothetical protein
MESRPTILLLLAAMESRPTILLIAGGYGKPSYDSSHCWRLWKAVLRFFSLLAAMESRPTILLLLAAMESCTTIILIAGGYGKLHYDSSIATVLLLTVGRFPYLPIGWGLKAAGVTRSTRSLLVPHFEHRVWQQLFAGVCHLALAEHVQSARLVIPGPIAPLAAWGETTCEFLLVYGPDLAINPSIA